MSDKKGKDFEVFNLVNCGLEGTNLIEASAGTGKTYAITGLFLRLILEKSIPPDRILVVTYTTSATKELKGRIYTTLLKAQRVLSGKTARDGSYIDDLKKRYVSEGTVKEKVKLLEYAIRNFDECTISTIHSFCQQMLIENAFESNSLYDTELVTDSRSILADVVLDFWRRYVYSAPIPVVSRIMKDGITRFTALYKTKLSNPDIRVIYKDSGIAVEDIQRVCDEAEEIFQKARALWRKNPPVKKALKDTEGYASLESLFQEERLPPDLVMPEAFSMLIRTGGKDSFAVMCNKIAEKCAAVSELSGTYLWKLRYLLFEEVERELETKKKVENVLFFDDLLVRLRNAVVTSGPDGKTIEKALSATIRDRFHAALIDEFQDTDPVQYMIFRTVFGGRRTLFVIGDPKQAIYSFRGADVFAYMQASENAEKRYTLKYNYRSESNLVEAVNVLFGQPAPLFIYSNISFERQVAQHKGRLVVEDDDPAPLKIWFIDETRYGKPGKTIAKGKMEEVIPPAVAFEIMRLVRLGREGRAYIIDEEGHRDPVMPGHITVLVRTKREARQVQQALSKCGIPSVLTGTVSVFESEEAVEIKRILIAVAFPSDERALKAAITTAVIGVSGNELDAILNDDEKWNTWFIRFNGYNEIFQKSGFIVMFRTLMTKEKVKERIVRYPDGERRITNILHIMELLHQEELEGKFGIVELVGWLDKEIQDKNSEEESNELRLESDEDAVQLITIHKAKGLEFPIVFSPYNWHGVKEDKGEFSYHDSADNYRLTLSLGDNENNPQSSPEKGQEKPPDEKREEAFKEELSENMRLLYVSLTRAKYRCYTVWGKINLAETSAPNCLFHAAACLTKKDSLTDELKAAYKHITGAEIRKRLGEFAATKRGCIEIADLPVEGLTEKYIPYERDIVLSCPEFQGTIDRTWRISSFSSLTSKKKTEEAAEDYDGAAKEQETTEVEEIPRDIFDIFTFPKGERAGVCFHSYLEEADFRDAGNGDTGRLIEKKLRTYGFDMRYAGAVQGMTGNLLKKRLSPDSAFCLADIETTRRISEMEFYFPLRRIVKEDLVALFGAPGIPLSDEYGYRIGRLEISPTEGFMRGFIDMVFEWNGTFYLVDWKSNYLGYGYDHYGEESVRATMKKHYYFLQYHIYALAFHEYLARRVSGYDYERHFGGVYYFFLRGINSDPNSRSGIFFDKPRRELIERMDSMLIRKGA